MQTKTVLFVDDNQILLNCLQKAFNRIGGYVTLTATNVKDALGLVENHDINFIVSDINMPDVDGIEFFRSLRNKSSKIPFIFMSGKVSEDELRFKLGKDNDGTYHSLTKPLSEKEIIAVMDRAA